MQNTQPLQFQTGEALEFFSTLRRRVDAYFKENKIDKHANATMWIKTVVLMAGYVLPFFALVYFQPVWWAALLLYFIMGVSLAGIGMSVMHDAVHGAYSGSHATNRWLGYSLNLLGGSVANWRVQHNQLHHMYTNITGYDDDIDSKLILRFSPHTEHKKVHRYQWWYSFLFYSILTLYWGLLKDLVQLIGYQKRGLHKMERSQMIGLIVRLSIVKLTYFFVFIGVPLIFTSLTWPVVVFGFLFMHFVGGVILSVVFQLAHTIEETEFPMPNEHGSLENSWAVHQLKTTANFSPNNKWLSWYVGGLNYQVEHHLFPGICHVHYPALAPIVRATAQEFGVPYHVNPSFMIALRSHVRMLYKLGTPPLAEIMG